MIEKLINKHLISYFDDKVEFEEIKGSGSNRKNYFIYDSSKKFILTINENIEENKSFIYFSELFYKNNISCPMILWVSKNFDMYLQTYNGNKCLLDFVLKDKNSSLTFDLYIQSIDILLLMQLDLKNKINYTKCFEFISFNKALIMNDLFHFKCLFLDVLNITYNKQKLISDFQKIEKQNDKFDNSYLMYRDFQARNIIVDIDNNLTIIDYQGAISGILCYDLISLLYQAKANLSLEWKEKLKEYYFTKIISKTNIERKTLNELFNFSLILRVFQTLGAYGLRGIVERKPHFISSIVFALENNIKELLANNLLNEYEELERISIYISSSKFIKKITNNVKNYNK